MTALASVKVTREKLGELLVEAKLERLVEANELVAKAEAELQGARDELVSAAKRDLSQDENIESLAQAVRAYEGRADQKRWKDRDVEQINKRYDDALRLVAISSDGTLKVTSHTEFGYLLGL